MSEEAECNGRRRMYAPLFTGGALPARPLGLLGRLALPAWYIVGSSVRIKLHAVSQVCSITNGYYVL
jgi:hypothetical protein